MEEIQAARPEAIKVIYGRSQESALDQLRYGGNFLLNHWPLIDPSKIYVAFEVKATREQIDLLKENALQAPLARLLRSLIGGSGQLTVNEELVPDSTNAESLLGTLWYAKG